MDAPLLWEQYSPDLVEELVDLITDTLGSSSPTLRIGREELPAVQVQERSSGWTTSTWSMFWTAWGKPPPPSGTSGLPAYRPVQRPATINHYYQAAVQHDLYGDSS